MAELAEKMEWRVHNLEEVIQMMNNEQKTEKSKTARLEVNDDGLRSHMSVMQKDISDKLEMRMTEVVQRLLMEQDERMKGYEDLRYQLDVKEKLINEKSKYEREEMRDRYQTMDAIVRAEFQRKDEAILAIQNNLEAQIKTINSWVK